VSDTGARLVIHRSNVNAWDCDENGHLNVRYYIHKNYQGLTHLLAEFGLPPSRLAELELRPRLVTQHVRYQCEARVAAPLVGTGAFVGVAGKRLIVYSELRNSMDDMLYTTFNSELEICDRDGHSVTPLLGPDCVAGEVPEHGAVRSLPAAAKPELSIEAARAAGYVETGRGTVMANECDRAGRLEAYEYAGRIADGIPNLMSTIQTAAEFALRAQGELGGAVIESRAVYHDELRAGERFVLLSGLCSFAAKTMHLSHLLFNLETNALAFSSEGIGVALDLRSRRAVPFAEERQALMRARLVTD
jgi:acyl-CoA thioester hydrolase